MKTDAQKIRPLGENILLKVEKVTTKTKSGLVLPDSADTDRPQQGKVIAVGTSDKIKVKKNQKVLFAKYSGTEIKIDTEEYLIIKNEDILAVME